MRLPRMSSLQNLRLLPQSPDNLHTHRQLHLRIILSGCKAHRDRHRRMPGDIKDSRVNRQPRARRDGLNRQTPFTIPRRNDRRRGHHHDIVFREQLLIQVSKLPTNVDSLAIQIRESRGEVQPVDDDVFRSRVRPLEALVCPGESLALHFSHVETPSAVSAPEKGLGAGDTLLDGPYGGPVEMFGDRHFVDCGAEFGESLDRALHGIVHG